MENLSEALNVFLSQYKLSDSNSIQFNENTLVILLSTNSVYFSIPFYVAFKYEHQISVSCESSWFLKNIELKRMVGKYLYVPYTLWRQLLLEYILSLYLPILMVILDETGSGLLFAMLQHAFKRFMMQTWNCLMLRSCPILYANNNVTLLHAAGISFTRCLSFTTLIPSSHHLLAESEWTYEYKCRSSFDWELIPMMILYTIEFGKFVLVWK